MEAVLTTNKFNTSFAGFQPHLEKKGEQPVIQPEAAELKSSFNYKAHLVEEIDNYGRREIGRILNTAPNSNDNRERIMQELEQMRRRFGYEQASMFERMLINQVLFCWLRMNLIQTRKSNENHSAKVSLNLSLQLRQAQAQFTKAYEALIKLKKMIPELECL